MTTKQENEILDRGYNAVRQMARELVENGASLPDVLFHANQVWHEFKYGSIVHKDNGDGTSEVMMFPGLIKTGMYIDNYNPKLTNEIIRSDTRYGGGIDHRRVLQFAEEIGKSKSAKRASRNKERQDSDTLARSN